MKHLLILFLFCFGVNAQVWEITDVKGTQENFSTRTNFGDVDKVLELLPASKTEKSSMLGQDLKNPRVYTFEIVKKPDKNNGLGFALVKTRGSKQIRNAIFQESKNMYVFTELLDQALSGDVTMQWAIHKKPKGKNGKHLATLTAHWNGLGGIRTYSMSGWAKKKE